MLARPCTRGQTARAQQSLTQGRDDCSEELVDTKLIGRNQARQWSFGAKACSAAVHPEFRQLPRDALSIGPTSPDENDLSEQMASRRRQLSCDSVRLGVDQSRDFIKGVDEGNAAEAWRR